jgi:hypothetical protein
MNKLTVKNLLIIAIALLLVNFFLSGMVFSIDTTVYHNIDGSVAEKSSDDFLRMIFLLFLIVLPVISLLLGFITTIFVKGNRYKERYTKGFLSTLSGFYCLLALLQIIRFTLLTIQTF